MTTMRYIPTDSVEVKLEEANSVVYKYTDRQGRISAVGYKGKQSKSIFHHYWKTEEQRNSFIETYNSRLVQVVADKAKWKVEAKQAKDSMIASLEVGTILYSSWGYDQTNVSFYQVISIKGKTLTLKELDRSIVNKPGYSSMSDHVVAIRDSFIDDSVYVTRSLSLSSYEHLHVWKGEPKYRSWDH